MRCPGVGCSPSIILHSFRVKWFISSVFPNLSIQHCVLGVRQHVNMLIGKQKHGQSPSRIWPQAFATTFSHFCVFFLSRSFRVLWKRVFGDLHLPGTVLRDAQPNPSVLGYLRPKQQFTREHRFQFPHDSNSRHASDSQHLSSTVHGHYFGSQWY